MESATAVGFVWTDKETLEAEVEITDQLFIIQEYGSFYKWDVIAVVSSWSTNEGYEELLRMMDEIPMGMLIVTKPIHTFTHSEALQKKLKEKNISVTTINIKKEAAVTFIPSSI